MNTSRRILVTGGTGTLGGGLVRALRAANYGVTANFWHDEARAAVLRRETGCELFRADLRDETQVAALFAAGKFETVIHGAGVTRDALLLRQTQKSWRDTLETNLDAAFLVARESLQTLPREGQLIFLASRAGEHGFAGQGAYAASKAALLGLMKTAAIEGKAEGLQICAVCPGYVSSNLSAGISARKTAARRAENVLDAADGGEALAAMISWILRAKPRISGQILRPDCRI